MVSVITLERLIHTRFYIPCCDFVIYEWMVPTAKVRSNTIYVRSVIYPPLARTFERAEHVAMDRRGLNV